MTWTERAALLNEPHIKPLKTFVGGLRTTQGEAVPYPDPLGAGTNARVLLLMEAPGRRALETGFVSLDSPDGTARNLTRALTESGLAREQVILWNIIPWYIGSKTKIRPATVKDVRAGLGQLESFLDLLPKLNTVVMLGRKAQAAREFLEERGGLRLLKTFHPSNQALTFDKTRFSHIVNALTQAAQRQD